MSGRCRRFRLAIFNANHDRPYDRPDHIWTNMLVAGETALGAKLQALPPTALIQEVCDRYWSQPKPTALMRQAGWFQL
jgi:hypothetical protein